MRSSGHVFALLCLPCVCCARRVQTSIGGIHDVTAVAHSPLEARSGTSRLTRLLSSKRRNGLPLQLRIGSGRIPASESQHGSLETEVETSETIAEHEFNTDGFSGLGSKLKELLRFRAGAANTATPVLWKLSPLGLFGLYLWSLLAPLSEKSSCALEKIDLIGTFILMFIVAVAVIASLRTSLFGLMHLHCTNAVMKHVVGMCSPLLSADRGLTFLLSGTISILLLIPLALIVGSVFLTIDLFIEAAPVAIPFFLASHFLWKQVSRHISPTAVRRLKVGTGRTTTFTLFGALLWTACVHIFTELGIAIPIPGLTV